MTANSPLLSLRSIRFGYPRAPVFLGPLSFSVEYGQFWGIIGPNGAGKSTLVRLLAGLLRPTEGACFFQGRSIASIGLRARARKIAFLPQRGADSSEFTVRELALTGRYPHRSMALFDSPEDHRIAEDSMRRAGVLGLADRALMAVSGGEAQRAHLAAILAQEPELLLLDEPTASLDLKFQLDVLKILDGQRAGGRRAVVAVLHDVNLAAMFCTHVLLLHQGRQVALGAPQDVLTPQGLREVYDVHLEAAPVTGCPGRWLVPSRVIEGQAERENSLMDARFP